jgi:hypothetical protein
MFLCIVIATFAVIYNFSREQKRNLSAASYLKVKFGDEILLHWDPIFYRFIEDDDFLAIFENLHNIPIMASFITNEETVDNFVCGKKRALKKGDIAYLFLAKRFPSIAEFNCLGVQIDYIELDLNIDKIDESNIDKILSNCERLHVLLDHIERDRNLFSKRVISCIDMILCGTRTDFLTLPPNDSLKEILERILQDTIFKKVRQDIIKVEFGDQFTLNWDGINHKIIKDENYFAILKNKSNIRSMAYFITNEEVVYDFVCNKRSALKKGDTAALLFTERNHFLYETNSPISCFIGRSFNPFTAFCRIWGGLLDYIEENRELVFQRVMSCLDNKDIPQK